MSEEQKARTYQVNGHEFVVAESYDDAELLQCRECLCREVLDEDEDPDDYLSLVTAECHIEWLRKPDDGFHGVALRNAGCFQGRELIGVREGGPIGEGEVADSVRVYDKDAPRLAGLLDKSTWREVSTRA